MTRSATQQVLPPVKTFSGSQQVWHGAGYLLSKSAQHLLCLLCINAWCLQACTDNPLFGKLMWSAGTSYGNKLCQHQTLVRAWSNLAPGTFASQTK